jgi:hypothetical protein
MNRMKAVGRCITIAAVTVLISATLQVSKAYPEAYIGGQFGMALPSIGGGLKEVDINSSLFLPGTTHSDLKLSNSFMWGVKAGYYFRSARWFGLEGEFFSTSPHIKEQIHSFSNASIPGSVSSSSPLQGAHFLVPQNTAATILRSWPWNLLRENQR